MSAPCFGAVLRAVEEAVVRNLPTGNLDAAPSGEEARHAPAYEPEPLGFWGEADRGAVVTRPRQQPLVPPESAKKRLPPCPPHRNGQPPNRTLSPSRCCMARKGFRGTRFPTITPPHPSTKPPSVRGSAASDGRCRSVTGNRAARRRAATSRQPRQTLRARTARNRAAWRRPGPRRPLRVHGADRRDVLLLLRDIRNGRDNASLLILDQHAAHERVLVSRMRGRGLFGHVPAPRCCRSNIRCIRRNGSAFRSFTNPSPRSGSSWRCGNREPEPSRLEVRAVPPLLERAAAGEFIREVLAGRKEDLPFALGHNGLQGRNQGRGRPRPG